MIRLVVIMRLAALFKYVEQLEQLPDFVIQARNNELHLDFPERWLEQHPLTAAELEGEISAMGKLGITLTIS